MWVRCCLATLCWSLPITSDAQSQRLTTDGRVKYSPTFIDETELVYVDLDKPELTVLQRLKLADGTTTPLHPNARAQELEPTFSHDGRWCAYLEAIGTLSVKLVVRDERGNVQAEVPPGGGFCGFRTPAFSPDGQTVIFSFADNGFQDLFTVTRDCKERKQITKNVGMNYFPTYSPDGKRILFCSTRAGNYEIYSMNTDGEHVVRLTDCPFQDLRPQYSPDGDRIAFTSARDGNFEIYIMQADGASPRRITNHPERDDYAIWHPDGKRLVIISERDGNHDLYLVDVD